MATIKAHIASATTAAALAAVGGHVGSAAWANSHAWLDKRPVETAAQAIADEIADRGGVRPVSLTCNEGCNALAELPGLPLQRVGDVRMVNRPDGSYRIRVASTQGAAVAVYNSKTATVRFKTVTS